MFLYTFITACLLACLVEYWARKMAVPRKERVKKYTEVKLDEI